MSDLKAYTKTFVKKKKIVEKKTGICIFLFGYFSQINILGFIIYSIILYIFLIFIVKLSHDFFP